MIRACGSRWMRLKKVSTIFDHYLKHAEIITQIQFVFQLFWLLAPEF